MDEETAGPFGPAQFLTSLPTAHVIEMYRAKCGIDITPHFHALAAISLYQCRLTGYRFWRPGEIAGNELFYQQVSHAWKDYYREWRWEYDPLLPLLRSSDDVLEVGCGRGYFLRGIEGRVRNALGLEFNREAIDNKVTRSEVRAATVEELARTAGNSFDFVCSFQVLEHVTDPAAFVRGCLGCLKPGGLLAFSTPDRDYLPHANRQDAFDLPPHHVGHFSAEVYARLADFYGLELLHVFRQPRYFQNEAVTAATSHRFLYRACNALVKRVFNVIYRLTGEPGANILVVFRKPSGSPTSDIKKSGG